MFVMVLVAFIIYKLSAYHIYKKKKLNDHKKIYNSHSITSSSSSLNMKADIRSVKRRVLMRENCIFLA